MYKVLILSLLAISLIASETPSTQAAAKVSDVLSKREEIVKKADAQAIKELKSLLVKFKKDKQTSILIAVKLHKLSADDADAIAILKDVPVGDQDLLGEMGEPGKYMGDVQAKLIADALMKGKFTGKDWDALPGTGYVIGSTEAPIVLTWTGEKRFILVPNPDDKWKQEKTIASVDWKGGNNAREMALVLRSESINSVDFYDAGKILSAKLEKTAVSIRVPGSMRIGSIRVKIYEVVPTE